MITYSNGDIFESGADILVNPVNCVGVMGAGLAAEFKRRFPNDFKRYADACKKELLRPGGNLITSAHGQFIYHFVTKQHWRDSSQMIFIDAGLYHLHRLSSMMNCPSLAIPALGCGLGGLPWDDVKPLIEQWFGDWQAEVIVFPPKETPNA